MLAFFFSSFLAREWSHTHFSNASIIMWSLKHEKIKVLTLECLKLSFEIKGFCNFFSCRVSSLNKSGETKIILFLVSAIIPKKSMTRRKNWTRSRLDYDWYHQLVGPVHTKPDIFETPYFLHESAFRPHVLQWIRSPKSHLYKNAL